MRDTGSTLKLWCLAVGTKRTRFVTLFAVRYAVAAGKAFIFLAHNGV